MRFNRELLSLYKNVPFGYKAYTFIRYAVCPFDTVERYVPREGKIVDLGCGHGVFANLLALKSSKRNVIGMDVIESKVKIGNSTLCGRKNLEFKTGGLDQGLDSIKDAQCFTLIDILCYIPLAEKQEFLRKVYNIMPAKATLVIKSIHEKPFWKYILTLLHMATVDKLMHKTFKKNSYFLKKHDYTSILNTIGYKVDFIDIGKGYPYPHCLYICNKS